MIASSSQDLRILAAVRALSREISTIELAMVEIALEPLRDRVGRYCRRWRCTF